MQNQDYKVKHKQLDNENFKPEALNKIVEWIFIP